MRTSKLAYRNFRGNFYRYVMYGLSNAFAVTAFFIFANFVFNPVFEPTNLGGHRIAAMGAVAGMIASQIIIVMFSVLFVGYSTNIFLKSRGKEFGLLSLYGMTKKQIRRYVGKENALLSLFSVVVGILTGMLLSKLFYMVMENLLSIDIPFMISLKAIVVTFLVFFLLFQIISYIMLFRIKDKEIAEQIKSTRKPRILPEFSKIKAVLGLVILLVAYGVAWFVDGVMVPLAMVPVTMLTILGSYFLFTQSCIYIGTRLKKSRRVKYHKIKLISSSQLIFKLKDTAKVMFLASILIAVSLTSTETIVSFYTEIPRMNNLDVYEDISMRYEYGTEDREEVPKIVEDVFKKHKLELKNKETIDALTLYNMDFELPNGVYANPGGLALSDYNKILRLAGKEELKLERGQAQYIHINEEHNPNILIGDYEPKLTEDHIRIGYGDREKTLKLGQEIFGAEINIGRLGYADLLILNDDDYKEMKEELIRKGNPEIEEDESEWDNLNLVSYDIYKFENPKDSLGIEDEIQEAVGEYKVLPFLRYSTLKEVERQFATILFIAFFIAFLFFIASGSIIYFKLFNEIREDKIEYDILEKIGMDKRDIKKIIRKQIGILLFLPFVVGSVHSLFALKSLSNLLRMNLIRNGLLVSLGFLVFQLIYFLVIKNIYMKKLKEY